jgi:Xaa-Pro aminopeptidase
MPLEAAPIYARRRARVQGLLGEDAVLVLPAAPEIVVGRDLDLRYRPDADLFYLTGYTEPGTVLVLSPGDHEEAFTLFVRPRDPEQERWSGVRGGPEAATALFGADAAYPLSELEERLPKLLARAETIYFPLGSGRNEVEALVRQLLGDARRRRQRTGRGPRALLEPGALLDEPRLLKDAHELTLLADAARLSAEAFLEAIPLIRPGAGEWEIEAALEQGFRRRGAEGVAFASIIASGPNATVLHYIENERVMRDGELLLIDAGARRRMYNGDISRTLPVSGRFTAPQRELYDAVRTALQRATAAIRPGATFAAVHDAALHLLVEALVGIGLLEGDVDDLIAREAYKPYYPHQTSHWLGLDVHDVGDYALRGEPRPLVPGMVLTVEPGLYFPPDDERVPKELRGLGIRIEDDIVVTDSGHENLTAALPTAADELEALLA